MSMISLRYQVSDLISQDITTVDTDNYEFGYGNEQNARRSSDGSLTLPSILISVRKIKKRHHDLVFFASWSPHSIPTRTAKINRINRLGYVKTSQKIPVSSCISTFRSILTFPWVELGGKVHITCAKTGYNASVTFHTKPFYGGKLHRVTGEVKNTSTGRVICKVNGEWNGKIELSFTSHQVCLSL